jgi:methylase of polypeptide subunit release factors
VTAQGRHGILDTLAAAYGAARRAGAAQSAVDQALFQAFARARKIAISPELLRPDDVPAEAAESLARLAATPLPPELPLHAFGRVFERSLDGPERKAEGIFYTPAPITRLIVERALGQAVRERRARALEAQAHPIDALLAFRRALFSLRIVDPACGTGAFLLAAHDLLVEEIMRVDRELRELGAAPPEGADPPLGLHGIDRDPDAVGIARLSLWLAQGTPAPPPGLDARLRPGDAVLSEPPSGRFDVVLGNPPFVRGERLRAHKALLRRAYASYHGAADLCVYFIERGLDLLAPGGRLGFVVSASLLRAEYATRLRSLLRTRTTIELIVDLGDTRAFPDAPDAYPALLVARASPPPAPHVTEGAALARGDEIASIPDKLRPVALHAGDDRGWQIASTHVRRIADTLFSRGKPLGELGRGTIYRGVLTGCTSAFVIDQATRDALVLAQPSSAPLFKPMLRGQDLGAFHQRDTGLYLIFARRGIDIDAYPAVRAHLERFRASLEPRDPQAPSAAGRKPGRYRWFEIQDAAAYHRAFDRPKIVWPDIARRPRFSFDERGRYLTNLGYFLPSDDLALLAVLASRPLWFALSSISLPLGERRGLLRYRLFSRFVERLPIPALDTETEARLAELARALGELCRARAEAAEDAAELSARIAACEEEIARHVARAFGLDAGDLRAIEEATGYAYGEL